MSGTAEHVAPPEPVALQPSPEARLMSSERAQQIAAAVEQLPDRQRPVFTLCHVAEQSTSEVSQALGFSEATVRVHLFRAVRKLRKLLAAARRYRVADSSIDRERQPYERAHLSDDRLIEICLADPVAPLERARTCAACERCERRRVELASTARRARPAGSTTKPTPRSRPIGSSGSTRGSCSASITTAGRRA